MKERPFWINRIESAWKKRPIVCLSAVRRAGKTTLAQMLSDTIYFNCDLPSSVRALSDPEFFFDGLEKGSKVIFPEFFDCANVSFNNNGQKLIIEKLMTNFKNEGNS